MKEDMEKMSDNYLDVVYEILEENLDELELEKIEDYKEIIKSLINAEKEYEFNDDRPRIKALLDSLIR